MISDILYPLDMVGCSFTPLASLTSHPSSQKYTSLVLLLSFSQRRVRGGVHVELIIADSTAMQTLNLWKTSLVNLANGSILMITNYTFQNNSLMANHETVITAVLTPTRDKQLYQRLSSSLGHALEYGLHAPSEQIPHTVRYPQLNQTLMKLLRWALSTNYALLLLR